jgi:hypothetical protein
MPEFFAALGPFEEVAFVTMPKASMGKQHGPMLGKDQIGLAGQPRPMQPKAETAPVQSTSQHDLWLGVLAPNTGHHPAANR